MEQSSNFQLTENLISSSGGDPDSNFGLNLTSAVNDSGVLRFPVEVSSATPAFAILFLISGIIGNLILIVSFLGRPKEKVVEGVDQVVGLLAVTGLLTTICSAPVQLYAFLLSEFPAAGTVCQLQGFALNLLCLLSIWYASTLSLERYTLVVSSHEHSLTFSLLNMNVILAGILVLLFIEVCGPVYGWAEYGYLEDPVVCLVNPVSNHIFTYALIHLICYVTAPVTLTIATGVFVIVQCYKNNEDITKGTQVFSSRRGVGVLCGALIVSVLTLIPYQLIVVLKAIEFQVIPEATVLSYWLQLTGISCVYPLVLLTATRQEVMAALFLVLRSWRRCCCFCDPGSDLGAVPDPESRLVAFQIQHGRSASAKSGATSSSTATTETTLAPPQTSPSSPLPVSDVIDVADSKV